MPERLECEVLQKVRYINRPTLTYDRRDGITPARRYHANEIMLTQRNRRTYIPTPAKILATTYVMVNGTRRVYRTTFRFVDTHTQTHTHTQTDRHTR